MSKTTDFKGGGRSYAAPEIEIADVSVEAGFAASFGSDPSVGGDNPVGPGSKSLFSAGGDEDWVSY